VLSAALAEGDKILYTGSDFPLHDMLEVVNDALRYLGEVPVPDTSITTAEDQTEYTLPAALVGRQLLDVEIQGQTGDADDNQYVPVENFDTLPPAMPGATSTIVLPQMSSGFTVRLTYLGIHPRVTDFDDFISKFIHPELLHSVVFAHAIQWKNDQNAISGGADNALIGLEQKAWSQVDRALRLHPITIPPRRIQGMPHWTPVDLRRTDLLPPYYGV
jgi:hypothetical protein